MIISEMIKNDFKIRIQFLHWKHPVLFKVYIYKIYITLNDNFALLLTSTIT